MKGGSRRDVLVGIDAGTSVIKSIAYSFDGRQLASFALPNVYCTKASVEVEQDMSRTWDDTAASLRGLGQRLPGGPSRVAAIAVTAQGDGTWLIDDHGKPTAPALLWLDSRAGPLVDPFRAGGNNGPLYARTGCGLSACQQGPQLLWLQRNRAEVIARSSTAFHCKDWLYFRLTGERATDPSEVTSTCGNFRTRGFDPETAKLMGMSELARLLPPIVDGVVTTHPLTTTAAGETGLPSGLPVSLGYVDFICTGLGAGLYDHDEGIGCTIIGSTGMHMRLASNPDSVVLNDERTGYTLPFPVPHHYAQIQSNMAATLNIDWLIDLARSLLQSHGVEKTREEMIAGLDARVLAAAPASLVFLPYISEAGERGPFVAPDARAQFIGLSMRHGYWDLMRAVFEGLAFAARDCYAAMGPLPREVRLTGGAARSTALRNILAAALKADIRVSTREEAGAAGAAMMAAVATGIYPDMDSCARDWVTPCIGPAHEPDDALAARYDRLFPAYRESRHAMRPVWKSLRESSLNVP